MADEEESRDKIDLLQPEILSKEALLEIFEKRDVETDGLESCAKSVLVNLFYKHVIPLPQRKYRMNRRGREMTKMQILLAKRKRTYEEMTSPTREHSTTVSKNSSDPSSRLLTSFSSLNSPEVRIKPPPSAINTERKIITLNSSKRLSESGKDLAAVKINDINVNKSVVANKTEDPGMTEKTLTKLKSPAVVSPSSKGTKIKLKRTSALANSSNHSNDNDKQTEAVVTVDTDETDTSPDAHSGHKSENCETKAVSVSDEEAEDAVVRKKFRRIDIKWP